MPSTVDDMAEASALRGAEPERLHVRVALLCFLVLFLEGYDITSMSYAIPSLVEAWHAKPPQFTTALTAGSFGLLFGALSAGLLGDRLGRKPVLIGCTAVFGLFSLLTAFSTGLVSLAVLRFLTGLGLGGGIPISIALATDYAPLRNPRRLVILMSAGVSVGNNTGGFIASQIVRQSSWETIFVVGGLLPILVAPLLIAFMPESPRSACRPRDRPCCAQGHAGGSVPPWSGATYVGAMDGQFVQPGRELPHPVLVACDPPRKGTVAVRGDPRDDNVRAGHDRRRTGHRTHRRSSRRRARDCLHSLHGGVLRVARRCVRTAVRRA